MKTLLTIFISGGLGSLARFALARWVSSFSSPTFPYGTLTVNIVACLVLGIFIGLADHRQLLSSQARLFWVFGFCGGFSTFSAFSYESLALYQNGQIAAMFSYIASSVIVGILATLVGLLVGQRI